MGFFKKLREGLEQDSVQRRYEQALAGWKDEAEHVRDLLGAAINIEGVYDESAIGIRLQPGEEVILALQGYSGLIEPRSSGGAYQGGSRGVSIRVMKGVSYRVGAHQGTYVPGPEVQKVIDTHGSVYITTTRVLYTSASRNREWSFAKTNEVFHSDTAVNGWGATYLSVSNRQKSSGFLYPLTEARRVRDHLVLAFAVHDGALQDLIDGLTQQAGELKKTKPQPPALPPED